MAALPMMIAVPPKTNSVATINVLKEKAVAVLKIQIVSTVKAAVITSAN